MAESLLKKYSSFMLSDVGNKRSNNEDFVDKYQPDDSLELQQSGCIYIVADGVGGAAKGEIASQYAVRKLIYEYYLFPDQSPAERLKRLIREIGNEIFQFSQDSSRVTQMATTMVAAVILGDKLTVANVGDSRAYVMRNGNVKQITRDHNFVGEMMRDGHLTEEEALVSKAKNKLTRSLGGEQDVSVDVFEYQLQEGDRILLCSDGLTRYSLSTDISELAAKGPINKGVENCINFALKKGGADNVSVLIAGYGLSAEDAAIGQGTGIKSPTDWETIHTDSFNYPWMRKRKKRRQLFSRANIPWFIAFIIILVMLCISLVVFNKLIISRITGTPLPYELSGTAVEMKNIEVGTISSTLTLTATQETPTPSLTITPSSTPSVTPTVTPSSSPSVTGTLSPTNTPTTTPTLTYTSTMTDTPTGHPDTTGSESFNKVCVHQVFGAESWDVIYKTILDVPPPTRITKKYSSCTVNFDNSSTCSSGQDYDTNQGLHTGDWLGIMEATKDECKNTQNFYWAKINN
jgi:PPM family protein phosphatase